ncbi:MAG TPA: hypothetical protein VJQ58_01775 [Burkholderiales bacterium]|nr:hypothetical protein [Burkholderiales bacterium]
MTGLGFLGLILISMGWLFFLGGVAINYQALRRSRKGIPFLPGVAGSLTVFFSIPALAKLGVEAPWPWLWILLPLVIDPSCALGVLRLLRQ